MPGLVLPLLQAFWHFQGNFITVDWQSIHGSGSSGSAWEAWRWHIYNGGVAALVEEHVTDGYANSYV